MSLLRTFHLSYLHTVDFHDISYTLKQCVKVKPGARGYQEKIYRLKLNSAAQDQLLLS